MSTSNSEPLPTDSRSESSHTPGPWWVDNRRPTGALQIQAEHRGVGSSYCVASVNYYEDDAANAHLIAAAPDLLEALKAALPILRKASDGAVAWGNAYGAIAKAEGRS